MIYNQATVHHLEQNKLTLLKIVCVIRVHLLLEDSCVLLSENVFTAHNEIVCWYHPALLHLRGQVDTRGAEQEGINVLERVTRIESSVVDDGRRYNLLSQLERFCSEVLNKVSEEYVDFLKGVT